MLRPAATHLFRGLKVARQTEKLVKFSFRLNFCGLGRRRLFLKSAHRRSFSLVFFLSLGDFGALVSFQEGRRDLWIRNVVRALVCERILSGYGFWS